MLNKKEKLQGTFIYKGDSETLRIRQTKRAIFMTIAFVLFAVPPLFIPQQLNAFLLEINQLALLQSYVIFTFLVGVLLLYCLVCVFTRYKLKPRIPASKGSVDGFSKRTWLCYELAPFCASLTTVIKIVGIFFAFSVWSLILVIVSLASTALIILTHRETRLAYSGNMTLLSDEEVKQYDKNPQEYFADENNPETEDFYD